MRNQLVSPRLLLALVAIVVVLLVAVAVLFGLGEVLAATGDAGGGLAVRYVALACGGLLVVSLVCLVLCLALNSLPDHDDRPDQSG